MSYNENYTENKALKYPTGYAPKIKYWMNVLAMCWEDYLFYANYAAQNAGTEQKSACIAYNKFLGAQKKLAYFTKKHTDYHGFHRFSNA